MKKFGLIGTSCAGKTTLAHQLVGRLKSYGVLADGLFSQDRKFSFPLSKIETEEAQNWMVTNLIAKETDLILHPDVDIYITDRTPIDLFAYYAYQFDTQLSRALWGYVKEWAKTYEVLYYMGPLPYQDDNKRPSDEFRNNVDRKLQQLIDEVPNVKFLERHEILVDLMTTAGLRKPGVKSEFTETDFQVLATSLQRRLVVKHGRKTDGLSDQDMWIIGTPDDVNRLVLFKAYIKGLVGAFVPFDLNVAPGIETFDFPYTIYEP